MMESEHRNKLIQLAEELSAPLDPIPVSIDDSPGSLADIKAVLFDIYGTLLVSAAGDLGLHAAEDKGALLTLAMQDASLRGDLQEAGTPGVLRMREAIQQSHERDRTVGVDYPEVDIRKIWSEVLVSLVDENLLTSSPSDEQVDIVAISYECRSNPCSPMPGMREVLSDLRDRGIVLGIVSNAQFYTPIVIEALCGFSAENLGFDPELCCWSYEHGVGKPSRALFEPVVPVLQGRGILPEETLYVGNDMLKDIWTANQCGMKTALFAGDARSLRLRESEPRCADLKPDWIVKSLDDLKS